MERDREEFSLDCHRETGGESGIGAAAEAEV